MRLIKYTMAVEANPNAIPFVAAKAPIIYGANIEKNRLQAFKKVSAVALASCGNSSA
jgi:hypothetical protein